MSRPRAYKWDKYFEERFEDVEKQPWMPKNIDNR